MKSGSASYQSSDLYLLAAAQIYDNFAFIQGLFEETFNNLVDRSHSQPLGFESQQIVQVLAKTNKRRMERASLSRYLQ